MVDHKVLNKSAIVVTRERGFPLYYGISGHPNTRMRSGAKHEMVASLQDLICSCSSEGPIAWRISREINALL